MCFTTGITWKKNPKLCKKQAIDLFLFCLIAIKKTKNSLPKRWKTKLLLFLVGQQSNNPTSIIADWNLAPFLSYALHCIVLFVLSFWALLFSLLLNFCRIRNLCCWDFCADPSLQISFICYYFLHISSTFWFP